jgi:hypothetical protein
MSSSETAMAKTDSATREELIFAIEQLTEQVRLLGNIIDDLTTELQWQNRNPPNGTSLPFMLTSLSADPTTRDWRVNQPWVEAPANAASPPIHSRTQTLFD